MQATRSPRSSFSFLLKKKRIGVRVGPGFQKSTPEKGEPSPRCEDSPPVREP